MIVKEAIHHILAENLTGKEYNSEECTEWCRTISDDIKNKMKGNAENIQGPHHTGKAGKRPQKIHFRENTGYLEMLPKHRESC